MDIITNDYIISFATPNASPNPPIISRGIWKVIYYDTEQLKFCLRFETADNTT